MELGQTVIDHNSLLVAFAISKHYHPDLIECLLKLGSYIELDISNYTTPIYHAAASGNALVVRDLLKFKANPTPTTHRDRLTPLDAAAKAGSAEIVEMLLIALKTLPPTISPPQISQELVTLATQGDGSLLWNAAKIGNTDMVVHLLALGSSLDYIKTSIDPKTKV